MKAKLILLSLCMVMTACVYDDELAEVTQLYTTEKETALPYTLPSIVKTSDTHESPSFPKETFAHVQISINNQMPDLHLIVESIRLCNIHLSGTYHPATEYQTAYWETDTTRTSLTLETGCIEVKPNEKIHLPESGSILFIPQSAKAWNPSSLPQSSEACYMLLNCKVFDKVILWGDENGNCAEVAIPLSIHFQPNQEYVINITMAPDCPWYNINGTTPKPLFVPITFDVTIEDWKE